MKPIAPLVLSPLGALYSAAIRTRIGLYKRGLLQVSRLEAPVISIGNITTGGTGKTPLVEWVARSLAREGKNVCILTRGYKRANPNQRVVVSDGQRVLASELAAGDEPRLLAENLLGMAAVISDADRFAAGQWAIREIGANVLVLDDGFQHLRLLRDLNIVSIDATNPWGGGKLLPYGRLREPLSSLCRADCIVLTRAEQVRELSSVKRKVTEITGGRPAFVSQMRTSRVKSLLPAFAPDSIPLRESIPRPVAAFCGVGNPDSFFGHLRAEGYELSSARSFPDHHSYDQQALDVLVEEAQRLGARSLITTAKDAIKLRSLNFALPCYVLEIELVIDEAERLLEMLRKAIAA
jgi:tetraacyldisaccharide 4'-kinase